MAIISSVVAEDQEQADGRRRITELHTDDQGVEHPRSYLAPADYVVDLVASAKRFETALAEQAETARRDALHDAGQAKIDAYLATANLQLLGLTEDEEAELKVRL